MFFHQLWKSLIPYTLKYYLNLSLSSLLLSSLVSSCLLPWPHLVSSLWGTYIKSMLYKRHSMFILGRFNIVKMSILSKLIYGFNVISVRIPTSYFTGIDIKFLWKCWRPRISNTILKNKQMGGLTLPDFKTIKLQQSRQGSTGKTIGT